MSETFSCRDCTEYYICKRRFDKVQRKECPILIEEEEPLSFRNPEGYPDPTAFFAMLNVLREERKRKAPKQRRHRTQVVHYDN